MLFRKRHSILAKIRHFCVTKSKKITAHRCMPDKPPNHVSIVHTSQPLLTQATMQTYPPQIQGDGPRRR